MGQSTEQKATYRGVAWNEPIIYQLSRPGRRGSAVATPCAGIEETVAGAGVCAAASEQNARKTRERVTENPPFVILNGIA